MYPMSQKQKLGIAAGAICLLLCSFGVFADAEPQPLLPDCSTKLNEQPTNRNPAYTGQLVEEPPITIDLEHDFKEQEWIENTLTITNPRDGAVKYLSLRSNWQNFSFSFEIKF
jgi:hypothetical protein